MKKTVQWIGGIFLFISIFMGCGGDNAYDGENGLLRTNSNSNGFLNSVQENILLKNSETLVNEVELMKVVLEGITSNLTVAEVEDLQVKFEAIIKAWKSVEALYVASEYDDNLRTMPINIDFFNKGKNLDTATNIDAALAIVGSLESSQLKNSSKTVTGLEYMIFGNQASIADLVTAMNLDSRKRIEAMKFAIEKILKNAILIRNFYKDDTKFQADLDETLNILVNTLVQSSFDLRELRIGEAAGFIVKTKDDPLAERLEYFRSKKSLKAIETILLTHQQMMGEQSFVNFGSFAKEKGADTIVTAIRANLTNALAIVAEFNTPIQDAITPTAVDVKVKRLYDEIANLQTNYFVSLINSLNLTADIIEADGD